MRHRSSPYLGNSRKVVVDKETSLLSTVDCLADESIVEVSLEAIKNRLQRLDNGYAMDVGDIAVAEATDMHRVRRWHLSANSGSLRHCDVDLRGVDVAQIPQVERRIVRYDTEPVGPQGGRHQFVAGARRKRSESIQTTAHPMEVAVAFHVNEHSVLCPNTCCVVRRHVAVLIRRDAEEFGVPRPSSMSSSK
jgi:hypothetical protein